jgi:hypothetical protein
MTFKEWLLEGILDDMVGSFPNKDIVPSEKRVASSNVKQVKRYEPRIYPGLKIKKFTEYYRSVGELKGLLGGKPITLPNIIKLYAMDYYAPADNVIYNLSVAEVNEVREYDRSRDVYGKMSPEEYDELKRNVGSKGIVNHGVIDMRRLPNGDVAVILGEGNHRLAIAKELGIKIMPIRFYIS